MLFMENKLDSIITKCISNIENHNYESFDAYDALSSKWINSFTSKCNIIRRIIIQINAKCIINIRPLLGIKKMVHTKTISDMLSIYSLTEINYEKATMMFDLLLKNGIRNNKSISWGLNFPYTSRFTNANEDTPNLYNTLNSGLSILDYYDATKDINVEKIIDQIIYFIITDLGFEYIDDNTIWVRYYPNQTFPILNVNATTAHFFLRVNKIFGINKIDPVMIERILNLVIKYQNADGSWYYSIDEKGKWIDGFHTGFIIDSLIYIYITGKFDIKEELEKGINFYLNKMFDKNGLPKYYDKSKYPIESQNCAQAIFSLSNINSYNSQKQNALLEKSINQTINHLYDNKGGFIHKKSKFLIYKHLYFRWSITPMILALLYAKKSLINAQNE